MRALFTTTPGAGHVNPMVPLAQAFAARGHEVVWAAAPGVCARLERAGFHARSAGPEADEMFGEFARRFPDIRALPPERRPDKMFPKLFGAVFAPAMLTELLPLARDVAPDLVVHDQAELAGPIAAAALGAPWVTHAFGQMLPPQRTAAAGRETAPLWREQGLEPPPYAGLYAHLYLDIYPPSLQAQDVGHVHATELVRPVPFAAASATAGTGILPPGDAPLVYLTFGTVAGPGFGPMAAALAGVRELRVRVLATVGPSRDPAALGPQPAHVRVVRYVPQTELLDHCAAVVSHAGSGTFLAALGSGLPQVLLPQMADQFLNAAAGDGAGAAIAVPPAEQSAPAIRDATARVLREPAFRAAAEALGGEIAAMPAPEDTVAAIEHRFGG